MATGFGSLGTAKYVLLTTFRKDGTPKPTAVWVALDNSVSPERLLIWTVTDSWKVRRIRNNSRVTVTKCDARGKPEGETLEATAELLDSVGTEFARTAIARKYGILGWIGVNFSKIRRGSSGTIGIAVTAH
ncbi:MAG: PPOX class F420-dependent oxidoreductase [Mycobacteriaceae bacterium]